MLRAGRFPRKEHAASSLIRLLQAHVLLFVVAAVFRQFARRLADPTFACPRLAWIV